VERTTRKEPCFLSDSEEEISEDLEKGGSCHLFSRKNHTCHGGGEKPEKKKNYEGENTKCPDTRGKKGRNLIPHREEGYRS